MNIYEKIAKVMQDVEYLAKDDNVSTGGSGSYRAISEEKVTSTVRKSLITNGIVIVPIAQEHSRTDETVTDKYGGTKINRLTTVNVTYRIQNTEDKDDYIDVMSSGTGSDTQDKGVGKAMTYAYKYMLLRTFAIPTGDDADKISSDVYDEQLRKGTKSKQEVEDDKYVKSLESKPVEQKYIDVIEAEAAETNTDISKMINFINDKYNTSATLLSELTTAQGLELIRVLQTKKDKKK